MASSLRVHAALCVLLALVLLVSCRAFDPEPVVVNAPPDTFLTGAPPELTGSRFLRHMYWHGTDRDGEVIGYYFAITDSTVEDESNRFDPAHNSSTLRPAPGRQVGYTSLSDSTFLFTIDRGSVPAKDITFHVAAVDDRGGIDPTPARLHFLVNGLGNPLIRFRVFTEEETGQDSGESRLRWVGSPRGGADPESPQKTVEPFVGFGRRFRVDWEASSPNGEILGYRYKASQHPLEPFLPRGGGGPLEWDPTLTSFTFDNAIPPDELGCNPITAENCPPHSVRWPSGKISLNVRAIDVARIVSEDELGELTLQVNYPPSSWIVETDEFPGFQRPGDQGPLERLEPGATVPLGSVVTIQMAGRDPSVGSSVDPDDPFCCDIVDDPGAPEVRCQTRLVFVGRSHRTTTSFSTSYDVPSERGLSSFRVGPFDFRVEGRCQDEHGRPDPTPEVIEFVGGYTPRITSVSPDDDDRIILHPPGRTPWADSTIEPTVTDQQLYWDGLRFNEDERPCSVGMFGNWYQFEVQFAGEAHPEEPDQHIRAWTYRYASSTDPFNSILDGPRDSQDLGFFQDVPLEDGWTWTAEVFIPTLVWFQLETFEDDPRNHEECSPGRAYAEVGRYLLRRLGTMQLDVVGRLTQNEEFFDVAIGTDATDGPFHSRINIGPLGRRTPVEHREFELRLGFPDPEDPNVVGRLWPE